MCASVCMSEQRPSRFNRNKSTAHSFMFFLFIHETGLV
jgi:hypothetical protein